MLTVNIAGAFAGSLAILGLVILLKCELNRENNINQREFNGKLFDRYDYRISMQALVDRYDSAMALKPADSIVYTAEPWEKTHHRATVVRVDGPSYALAA